MSKILDSLPRLKRKTVVALCLAAGFAIAGTHQSAAQGTPTGGAQAQEKTAESALVSPEWCRDLPRPGYKTLERVAVRDNWVEVYRVFPGVFAIYEPHQWQEAIQYLIVGTRQAILVDTGMGIGNLKAVVEQLTTLPVLVVNSHTHMDHTGNNWQFAAVAALDTAYSRENAKGADNLKGEIAPGKLCGRLPAGFDAKDYRTRPWTITRTIHDGDKLDIGGRVLTVMATPGHAPDSLCLLDRANGLLFTGDTYYPGPIYVFGAGASPEAYERSVRRLAKLMPEVKAVLGGHNFPVAAPDVLPRLAKEFEDIRAGKIAGKPVGDGVSEFHGPTLTFFVKSGS